MARTFSAASSLALTTLLLAGCQSTEGPYPQGPWGPQPVARLYPAYPAPWGPPLPGRFAVVAVPPPGPVLETEVVVEQTVPGRREAWVKPRLPYDPMPAPSLFSPPDAAIEAAPIAPAESAFPPRDVVPPHNPAPLPSPADPGTISPPRHATSYAGTWKAVVSGHASCRVRLSSSPALDLYRASTSDCSGNALDGVNAWNFSGNAVTLYSRGKVVAHLSGLEASLSGTLSGSGARLTMTR